MERRTRSSVATAVVLACLAVALPSAPVSAAPDPVRILVLGDSVAVGTAGDWTWRYRLWQALEEGDVDVDFVGPHRDVYDNVANLPGSDAYADPDFDRDHGARWATLLAEPETPIAELVATYHPDVIVETRGLNDLINAPWRGWTTDQVADRFVDEIDDARAVDPTIDVVVAQLPQTWLQEPDRQVAAVKTLNGLLDTTVAALDDPASRVVVARTGTGFVEGVDTWDPAHLTASGELTMAAGLTDALADIGVGEPYPRPLPTV